MLNNATPMIAFVLSFLMILIIIYQLQRNRNQGTVQTIDRISPMHDSIQSVDSIHMSPMQELFQTADCMSSVMTGIGTIELIRMFYGSSIRIEAYTKSIAKELRKRMTALDVDKFEENKQILFEIYNQCVDGKQALQSAKERISEIVRMKLQQIINPRCQRICSLSERQDTGVNITNQLLEALDYFGKHIVVPSHVEYFYLCGLQFTSLWFKFEPDSKIKYLSLDNNDFKKLNYETFGRFIHERAPQKLDTISISSNDNLVGIDFDELMLPNIRTFHSTDCRSLAVIKNIPKSMKLMFLDRSDIKTSEQLQFKEKEGNNLECIYCNKDCEQEFKNVLVSLYPGREFEWHFYEERDTHASVRIILK